MVTETWISDRQLLENEQNESITLKKENNKNIFLPMIKVWPSSFLKLEFWKTCIHIYE